MKQFVSTCMIFWVLMLFACLKKESSPPPDRRSHDPDVPVTHSVRALLRLLDAYDPFTGGDTTCISSDITVAGRVAANDKSGNFYKQIILQDDSAALTIRLDHSSLYNDFQEGRKLYLHCKGLWLGYDGGLPVLGYSPDEQLTPQPIPGHRIEAYIVKGPIGGMVVPDTLMPEQVSRADPAWYNKLVYVPGVQFKDIGLSYSMAAAATSRELQDCNGSRFVTRNSPYASFAGLPLPEGKGSVTGIYTVYISAGGTITPQIVLRDTSDVKMPEPRCGMITGNMLFYENFERANVTGRLLLPGWINQAVQETGVYYTGASFGGTRYARITGYGSGSPEITSWLITPEILIEDADHPVLGFYTLDGYDNGASLRVYMTGHYTGDPGTTEWMPLDAYISRGHLSGYAQEWRYSGDIPLPLRYEKIRIGFRYDGADPPGNGQDRTTTFQIDDVFVAGR